MTVSHVSGYRHVTGIVNCTRKQTICCTSLHQFLCFCGFASAKSGVVNPFWLDRKDDGVHLLQSRSITSEKFDIHTIRFLKGPDCAFYCDQGFNW